MHVILICLFNSGIQGDGRCLFRSVVYGACLRTGEPSPNLIRQKELADELRAKVTNSSLLKLSGVIVITSIYGEQSAILLQLDHTSELKLCDFNPFLYVVFIKFLFAGCG